MSSEKSERVQKLINSDNVDRVYYNCKVFKHVETRYEANHTNAQTIL